MDDEKKISKEKIIELINEFEYFNPETKYIYKRHGNVIQRYSKYLTKWILELNGREINLNTLTPKMELSDCDRQDIMDELM